ncbi:hypothetical protein GGU11DRAFT_836677 [Lentinula aff. detonsa]|nr:hypothetical protein GGU11DRAFT_836677 [Lentinula aff. detonsa]
MSPKKPTRCAFRRKASNIKSLFQECNRQGCTNHVQVYLCTGTNYAHHRGHWYEACVDMSNPSDTHFVTWRPDIPPYHFEDLVHRRLRGVLPVISPTRKAKMSMQSLINQNVEEQPFVPFPPSPSRMLGRPNEGHSPVKSRQAALDSLFDFAQPIEIPDHILSKEESLQFSKNLDRVEVEMEATFGELDMAGPQALQEVLEYHLRENSNSVTTSQSASLEASARSEALIDTVITDANSESTACSGNTSLTTSTHDSTLSNLLVSSSDLPSNIPSCIELLSRAADSEDKQTSALAQPFEWQIGKTEQQLFNGTLRKCCLACCAIYQQEVSSSCKEAGHKPSGKESAATASSSSLYNHTRPLKPLHYEQRGQARTEYHQRSKILQDQQIYANDVKKNVRIKFWDENGQMDMLTVESPTHPYFCIDNCSVPVREVLGVTNGKLVRIFDPKTRSWVLEESCNKWLMYDGEILLIRPRSCTKGVRMQEAEEEETNRQRPQKRKFNDDIQMISAPSTPSRGAACEKASSMRTGSTSCRVPMNPSCLPSPVCTLASIRELSSLPDLPSVIVPTSRPPTPSPAPKVKRAKVAEDEGIIDLTVPSSRHGAWPWKLYKGMHEGFLQLEKKGPKHDDVFPSGSAAKTKASARAAWAAGTSELKAKFYSDPRSTWKAYINAVKELHGGTIPSHSDSRKTKKIPQALNVKHEVIEFDLD